MSDNSHPNKTSIWLADETKAQIADLARPWGAIDRPLPVSRVIAEAVRRAWEQEQKRAKRKGGRP